MIRMKHSVMNIIIKVADASIIIELETCGWYLL